MDMEIKVPQISFDTLKEFIEGSNNFHAHFLDDCIWGLMHRKRPYFQRFQTHYPELEEDLTRETTLAYRSQYKNPPCLEMPHEKHWEAYNLMSCFVYITDKSATLNGKLNSSLLIS